MASTDFNELPRSSDKPISCRFRTSGASVAITKGHENRHFPVVLSTNVANDEHEHPTVELHHAGTGERIFGELLDVDTDSGECSVLPKGIMYYRSTAAYAQAQNGQRAGGANNMNAITPVADGATAINDNPVIEGGFSKTEGSNTINVVRTRR